MRIALILFFALASLACSPAAMPLPVGHPARADATPGRLADPPAALRRGVTERVEPAPPVDHSKHEGHQ